MSIQVNRSCSRYITSMATLLLRWTSSQVVTVKLFTHVPATDHPLVTDTTYTYPTTLQATAIPTLTVTGPTLSPWVLCIWLFLSILCRWIQYLLHSHWCWSVLRDNNLNPVKVDHVYRQSKPSINTSYMNSQGKVSKMEVFVSIK